MRKCPDMPKASELRRTIRPSPPPPFLSLERLARFQGVSQRTVRKYCQSGMISEAYATKGGHWRVRMPLSPQTRLFLAARSKKWPFGRRDEEDEGELESEWAKSLLLAHFYELDINEPLPTSYLAAIEHRSYRRLPKTRAIRGAMSAWARALTIENEVNHRMMTGQSLRALILVGSVYQLWRRNPRRPPTVTEVSKMMRISRGAFYRLYSGRTVANEIEDAYFTASKERSSARPPPPDGLDSVQRANRNAKKVTSGKIR
jgi:hypothetical protein